MSDPVLAPPGMSASVAGAGFDVEVGGLRVLLPAGVACEYFTQAVVYPVPRSPRRLFGMMHLRGYPVPVFDTQPTATELLPIVQRCRLIVLRDGADAVAFICDRPPSPVVVGDALPDAAKPESGFRSMLIEARRVRDDDGEGIAWLFDLNELIDLAAGFGPEQASDQ